MSFPRGMAAAILPLALLVIALQGCAGTGDRPAGSTEEGPISLARQDYFFAGGSYVQGATGAMRSGSMYVERFTPSRKLHPYPVVMIHGGGQTGSNFTGTPDGRRGWVHDFLRAGYEVLVADQPARARSGQFDDLYGPSTHNPTRYIEQRFTAPEDFKLWPQATAHTQWPGSGRQGDPVFDQFFAAQVPSLTDGALIERLNRDAGVALLDRIGPAILLVHSQSGPFGWLLADARPQLVKAVLSIEPNGPPFREVEFKGAPDWFGYQDKVTRNYGITRIPLTYDPPVGRPEELRAQLEATAERPDLVRCYRQGEPARRLGRLQGIPILIVVAEASYHAAYDHCTRRYLEQAGVQSDWLSLPEAGIRGNGHMMMIERNNHEVAARLLGWLSQRGV